MHWLQLSTLGIGLGTYLYYQTYQKRHAMTAVQALGFRDAYGQPIFSDAAECQMFLQHGRKKNVEAFVELQRTGNKTLWPEDISLFLSTGISAQEVATSSETNPWQIYYDHRLGKCDFDTSDKPKALLLFPSHDYTRPYSEFEYFFTIPETRPFGCKEQKKVVQAIKTRYNTRLRAVNSVEELCAEVELNPDLALLVISGHGQQDELQLSRYSRLMNDQNNGRTEHVTVSTKTPLNSTLSQLPPSCVIFINSCLTGEGRDEADNLANHIAREASGREVISSQISFGASDIKITSLYPFMARIIKGRTDHTYITTHRCEMNPSEITNLPVPASLALTRYR